MLRLDYYKNKNRNSRFFGKVYSRVSNNKLFGIDELAKHMADHNTSFSKGQIAGILTDMAACIRELALGGQPVKIDNLCIFKAAVTSKPAADVEHYAIGEHVKQVRLATQATGECTPKNMKASASLGWTTMAQKIQAGEAELSGEKGVYLVGGSAEPQPSGNDEP